MNELRLLLLFLSEPIFSKTPAQNTSIYQSSLAEELPKIAKYLGNSPNNLRVVNGDRVTYRVVVQEFHQHGSKLPHPMTLKNHLVQQRSSLLCSTHVLHFE